MIKQVIKEEYLPILETMGDWDPHDLVAPDKWFPNDNAMIGFVYRLFLNEVREKEKKKLIFPMVHRIR